MREVYNKKAELSTTSRVARGALAFFLPFVALNQVAEMVAGMAIDYANTVDKPDRIQTLLDTTPGLEKGIGGLFGMQDDIWDEDTGRLTIKADNFLTFGTHFESNYPEVADLTSAIPLALMGGVVAEGMRFYKNRNAKKVSNQIATQTESEVIAT